MSHTPGPWTLETGTPGDGHHYIQGADGSDVVSTDDGWNNNYRNYDERLANARLIAAAPELLVACRAALNDRMFKEWPGIATMLMAAISKAEGK